MPLQIFNNDIPSHAKDEEDDGGDDLGEDADSGGVGDEGEEEAHGLPESVVGEGSLLVVGEETAVERVDLGLPDGVADPPEGGEEVDDAKGALGRGPGQHHDDHKSVEAGAKDEDGQPSNLLDDEPKADGGKSVTDSKEDQNSSNCVNSIGTGDKSLE